MYLILLPVGSVDEFLVLIVFRFLLCRFASHQSGRQKPNLHGVAVAVVVDADIAVVVVLVQDPIETSPAMKIHMAIGNFLPLRVHRTRLMERLMKGAVVATGDPVVLSVVADEAVSATEKLELEKNWTTTLVGHSSVVVVLDVGMCGICSVSLLAES